MDRLSRPEMKDTMTMEVDTARDLTVQILAQIRDNLSEINRKQDAIGSKVDDATTRIVRLEERDSRFDRLQKQTDRLDAKMDMLLKDKDRRDGATGLVTWLFKNWPGLIGFIAMVIIVLQSNDRL